MHDADGQTAPDRACVSADHSPSESTVSHAAAPHKARAHADRARQFMPFAALKGYYELVAQQERISQPRHRLTEEEARDLSAQLSILHKGDLARVTYYDTDAYVTKQGIVARIDTTFRALRIIKTDIPFDDIVRIEPIGSANTQPSSATTE